MAFDSRYLRGRHFEGSDNGWKWAWRGFWLQKVLGFNRHVPWPVNINTIITNPQLMEIHPDDLHSFQNSGQYFGNTNGGRIILGRGAYIASNVCMVTANHKAYDLTSHEPAKDIVLAENCWVGMNSVILPGVVLGEHTIVAAGCVVTKSFPQGHVVLVGNPARIAKKLEKHPDYSYTEGNVADTKTAEPSA